MSTDFKRFSNLINEYVELGDPDTYTGLSEGAATFRDGCMRGRALQITNMVITDSDLMAVIRQRAAQ